MWMWRKFLKDDLVCCPGQNVWHSSRHWLQNTL